mmetsp:Transcript_15971/g.26187  ORF Transcript_15971/g.26187 Transcript_15971/m.26187 type:complete len:298 (+) Transcript_15971:177-1070(+)
MKNTNAFTWETYAVPAAASALSALSDGPEMFEIRTMRAGRTGARKTWSAAPVLLDYLSLKDGLKDINLKNFDDGSLLDMTLETVSDGLRTHSFYNILELGGGSGFLSVGLAKALRSSSDSATCKTKIMCTDSDKNTIKNMRYNVTENNESKTIAVQKLDWSDDDIGGDTFASALERTFKAKNNTHDVVEEENSSFDPISLLTHVIGSDVHFGHQTLQPLSSIIAAIKHRNPSVQVIIMLKERSENGVGDLVSEIEKKLKERNNDEDGMCNNYAVHVRDVKESKVPEESELQMKLVEC